MKFDRPERVSCCLDYDLDHKLFQAAKKATVNYNKRLIGNLPRKNSFI